MSSNKKRIEILDELRGFAIIAMIIHHFFLDVGNILYQDWGYEIFSKLCIVQPVFWTIFIVISGICTRLSRNPIKRGVIVFLSGMAVTLVTAVIMPAINIHGAEIYFGILHFMGIAMIITGLAMPLIEKTDVILGMIICAVLFAFTYGINNSTLCFGLIELPKASTNILMPIGIYNDSFKSADYFSVFPWIFMFLMGAFIGKYAKEDRFPGWTYKKRVKAFAFVGRNSLWFYLGHQAVLYALLYAVLWAVELITKIRIEKGW